MELNEIKKALFEALAPLDIDQLVKDRVLERTGDNNEYKLLKLPEDNKAFSVRIKTLTQTPDGLFITLSSEKNFEELRNKLWETSYHS